MTEEQKDEIADYLIRYFEESQEDAERTGSKFSQNDLSDRIGLDSGRLGYILKKEFNIKNANKNLLLNDRVWRKVAHYLEIGRKIWDLDNFTLCKNTFIECKLNHEQRIIDGAKGLGKTFAARQFVKRYPTNSFLITCSSDMRAVDFLRAVGEAIGMTKGYLAGMRFDLRRSIGDRLIEMKNPLLIIDETEVAIEQKKHSFIATLKDLYDYRSLHEHLGIAVMGANNFLLRVQERAGMKNQFTYPQFYSRFGSEPVYLNPYNRPQAKKICKFHGIAEPAVLQYIVTKAEDYRQLNDHISRYLSDQGLFIDKVNTSLSHRKAS